jgi:peroxiredoxin Q/BCP
MNEILEVGMKCPYFETTLTDGTKCSIDDFKHNYLILYFYPKDNTPGCTVQAIDFSRLQNEFAKQNVRILGVSRDSVASHQKFCDNHSLTIPLASDTEGQLCELFNVLKDKSLFGKKYKSIERSSFLIDPNGKIHNIWRNVLSLGHAQKLLEYVKKNTGANQ